MYNELNILLVEDNPGDALLIKEMVRDSEFKSATLIVVSSLAAAQRENVAGKKIALILLDLSLPDSEGMASIHAMREHFPDSVLIILTGLDDETVAVNALKEGAQHYLVKGEINEKILERSIRYAIERHEIINKLKLSEEKFSKLFYANPMIVLITSYKDGTIISANDECLRAFEYTREELIGNTVPGLNMWHDSIDREQTLKLLERDGVIKNQESRFRSKSGKIRHGLISVEILELPEGKVLVTFANDITDLKKTEDALKESEVQLRETFNELNTYLYKSSHDLRSPAANINAVLSLLSKQGLSSENFENYL
ncbi:MAG: response regulator, partial [Bacteroidia bacterium]|nr:response regulator [Bacteroidia bacterium]